MSTDEIEILRCPTELYAEAFALVLGDWAPSDRRQIAQLAVASAGAAPQPLFIARRGAALRGAAWGQLQAGNFAVFWPPQLVPGEAAETAERLAEAVVCALDLAGVDLAQSLVSNPAAETMAALNHAGFLHSAELLYMASAAASFPAAEPSSAELVFEEYSESQRERLSRLVESTYVGTLDCNALDGARDLEDVIDGYRATGAFRPQNWLFARSADQDVGVLLLADHPQARHWELMYLGIVPECRGRGWGGQIARYAQWLARCAAVDRLLVAVDAANTPAVDLYRRTGFEMWDRRTVYLRFPPRTSK